MILKTGDFDLDLLGQLGLKLKLFIDHLSMGKQKRLLELRVYGSRPRQTAYHLLVWDRKWRACGPSGRLASAKLVHFKYGIVIYLFDFITF